MSAFDAVVIGAGNGGLTAAASLARAGVKTLLLERHNIPGGCATSFCRGRFEFEVALHQLSGLGLPENPGPLRTFLNQFGVPERCEFVAMENLYRIIVPGKLDLILPANREGSTKALVERFPEEKAGIEGLIDLIYRFFYEMAGAFFLRDPEQSAEKYPLLARYALKPSAEVMDEFIQDPLLRLAMGVYWSYMGVSPQYLTFMDYAMLYFAYWEWKPYHVKHGSQAMSSAILDDFLAHGGQTRFQCGAKKILIEDGRIVGVETEYGDVIETRAVVSNASSLDTYVELIGEEHIPEDQFKVFAGQTVGPSSLTLYVGLDCPPEEVGINEATNFIGDTVDMEKQFAATRRIDTKDDALLLSCYNLVDPDASPPGTSQIAIVDLQYAEPWLAVPPSDYHRTKFECAETLLQRVEQVFPGFRSHIEEIEVATPLTHMRYLNTPGGAIYGFDQYAKDSNLFISQAAPVKGLALAGAWAGAGGFQPSLMSGGTAAKAIIRYLGKMEGGAK
ncbi:MAG: phytoene desaturase family protein [Solirubrobacterales bacterium]